MKKFKWFLALSVSVSCVALAVETQPLKKETETQVKKISELSPEELERREQMMMRLMGLPCDPYPKCAG